ncbi:MAG: N-formylglutamate amidohydrolase [Planctomycetes bacterium]|nr:N-formylglutamate amidohydrolase [Planctomycetota bacterium]
MPRFDALLVTCEHASRAVPRAYAAAFAGRAELLASHRGWDPGARVLAEELAAAAGTTAHLGEVTRLLVDLNRREGTRATFSELTPPDAREALLARYHRPYRAAVLAEARAACARGRLLHVSCHSFTPVWNGAERRVDVGVLFDPRRPAERATAHAWQRELARARPELRVRRNAPYRGVTDGICTWLRRELPRGRYAGLEFELNQAIAARPPRAWRDVRAALVELVLASLGR